MVHCLLIDVAPIVGGDGIVIGPCFVIYHICST